MQDVVFPISAVFPMGFSWSSFVAQSCMLEVCTYAGLREDRILADDVPPPIRTDSAFALATDDVMLFTQSGAVASNQLLDRLDKAFLKVGVQKHPEKDVNAASSATCIGVDVDRGRFLAPSAPSLVASLLPAPLR